MNSPIGLRRVKSKQPTTIPLLSRPMYDIYHKAINDNEFLVGLAFNLATAIDVVNHNRPYSAKKTRDVCSALYCTLLV